MVTWLIAGLGNPGPSYVMTRHNAGFMAVDRITHRYSFASARMKFHSEVREGTIEDQKTLAVKPQQFMNLSGGTLREVMSFYKIPLEKTLVIHDDIDLPFAKVKVKIGGGNGGHNGLRSIDSHIGKDYLRLRIGVGHPGDKEDVSNYVLGSFNSHEAEQLGSVLDDIATHLPTLLTEGGDAFMNKLAIKG